MKLAVTLYHFVILEWLVLQINGMTMYIRAYGIIIHSLIYRIGDLDQHTERNFLKCKFRHCPIRLFLFPLPELQTGLFEHKLKKPIVL